MEIDDIGARYIRRYSDGCEFLIVQLSSDREPGIEFAQDEMWRCAEFQIDDDGMLLGAQIVLYTEAELNAFEPCGNICPSLGSMR